MTLPHGHDVTEAEIEWMWREARKVAAQAHSRLLEAATLHVAGGDARAGWRDLSPDQRARRAALVIGGLTMVTSTLQHSARLYLRSIFGGERAEEMLVEGLAAVACEAAPPPADGQ